MQQLLNDIISLVVKWWKTPTVVDHVVPTTAPAPQQAPAQPVAAPAASLAPQAAHQAPILFDTPQNTRHSVRALCDAAGLPLVANIPVNGRMYMPKDIVCAVIGGESGWMNCRPDGTPVTHKNMVNGKLSSTDWGLCQINDYFHIGRGKDFPSVDYVMANPQKVVEWMIGMYKAGFIKQWDAYLNGSYAQYL